MTLDLSVWNFFLVFGRTSALVAFFPMLSEVQSPRTVRVGLALWISLAILPTLPPSSWQPANVPDLALAVGLETVVGAFFAFAIRLVFSAILLGAQWIDSEIGFQVAQQINPLSGVPNSPFGSVAMVTSALLFWSLGFFENLLLLWARMFHSLPAPILTMPLEVGDTLLHLSARIFSGALEVAIPIVLVMFLVTLAIALMARAIQGVNLFVEAYNIKLAAGIGALVMTSPLILALMQKQLDGIPNAWMALARALKSP